MHRFKPRKPQKCHILALFFHQKTTKKQLFFVKKTKKTGFLMSFQGLF